MVNPLAGYVHVQVTRQSIAQSEVQSWRGVTVQTTRVHELVTSERALLQIIRSLFLPESVL